MSLRNKVHKAVHRLMGGSVVLTASLQQMQVIDLAKIFGDVHGARIAMGLGTAIMLLEFLPLVVGFFADDDTPDSGGK